MKNTIRTTIIVVLATMGLMWWGQLARSTRASPGSYANSSNAKTSALTTGPTLFDFGQIAMIKGNVNTEFKVTNTTSKDITIARLVTSCMCTKAYIEGGAEKKGPFGMPGHGGPVPPADELIKAGESRIIRVVYDPNAHGPAGVGSIDRFIELTDDTGGVIRFEIKALVTP